MRKWLHIVLLISPIFLASILVVSFFPLRKYVSRNAIRVRVVKSANGSERTVETRSPLMLIASLLCTSDYLEGEFQRSKDPNVLVLRDMLKNGKVVIDDTIEK
jgi:hypothetical protein